MKKLISDKELVAYIDGQLSKEEVCSLKARALENGETDLLLHVQLAALACDEELADELLGKDFFMQDDEHQSTIAIAAKSFSVDKFDKKEE